MTPQQIRDLARAISDEWARETFCGSPIRLQAIIERHISNALAQQPILTAEAISEWQCNYMPRRRKPGK